jgi:hypothetical protein
MKKIIFLLAFCLLFTNVGFAQDRVSSPDEFGSFAAITFAILHADLTPEELDKVNETWNQEIRTIMFGFIFHNPNRSVEIPDCWIKETVKFLSFLNSFDSYQTQKRRDFFYLYEILDSPKIFYRLIRSKEEVEQKVAYLMWQHMEISIHMIIQRTWRTK